MSTCSFSQQTYGNIVVHHLYLVNNLFFSAILSSRLFRP